MSAAELHGAPRVSMIVAMDQNRAIGVDNRLPWNLPADLKRFKDLTMGHHIVMGRKTFDSIGRVLPGRVSVIVTRQKNYVAPQGCKTAHSLEEALQASAGDPEIFVIGGSEIFKQALGIVDRMYVTWIETRVERADSFFPEIDKARWRVMEEASHPADAKNPVPFRFVTYVRK